MRIWRELKKRRRAARIAEIRRTRAGIMKLTEFLDGLIAAAPALIEAAEIFKKSGTTPVIPKKPNLKIVR